MKAVSSHLFRPNLLLCGLLLTSGMFHYSTLEAQNPQDFGEIKSIRTHALFQSGDQEMDVTLVKQGQDLMRLSSGNRNRSYELALVYRSNSVHRREWINAEPFESEKQPDNQFTDLFDMVAINPFYHFERQNKFDMSFFKENGYWIEYKKADTSVDDGFIENVPFSLKLYRDKGGRSILLRKADYKSIMKRSDGIVQPEEIVFTNELTGKTVRVIITKLEINMAPPAFLFEI